MKLVQGGEYRRRKARYMMEDCLEVLRLNPELKPYAGDIQMRLRRFYEEKERLAPSGKLADFANGYLFYGIHRTETGWVYREWAPGAESMHLVGDFNGWNPESHPMEPIGDGNWEIRLEGRDTLKHLDYVKVAVTANGKTELRIPLYATYVVQDPNTYAFCSRIWSPEEPFCWTDGAFSRKKNNPPLIYEAHVGMATEEERVGTYREFTENMLPRIKADGYNTIQLMAIMEHPYYGSFGYQVSNFFAASSRFGTPDDLKALINTAHHMGISVLLDVVHSHAVKNTAEGINRFDGTDCQFFKDGPAGDHPSWDTKVFDYGKDGVKHFLLSNLKFWMEEYHFDGFRFDGVTSMLYQNHALGTAFTGPEQYFSMNTDVDAVAYLQLASELVHELKTDVLCIAEDMSGMPGMCLPIADGGIGFDYRLNMGLPDYFIRIVKECPMGHWSMDKLFGELCLRRPNERRIGYVESHDQALVGDVTLMFRMADQEMYWGMRKDQDNLVVEHAISMSKLIRLITIAVGSEGYLNFMGNEFGHPEWIDFPREGNGWSYHHARRLWSCGDDKNLRYQYLGTFDKSLLSFVKRTRMMNTPEVHLLRIHETDQILVFEKKGYIFAMNFHPNNSQTALYIPARTPGNYQVVFSTDDPRFGGYGNVDKKYVYHTEAPEHGGGFPIYLPALTAVVLKRIKQK
ncbi:MAG: alpha amylase C-terminal domain-containing protein [Oscillospiraceae bacterium]|nr:alpha amylase C-terminal domain-containing protein [Oscillospiraceae bacterium]